MTTVDLIIPTHNSPELLMQCLRSVAAMPYTEFRLIVVDDASTQPVRQEVHSLFPGATVIRNSERRGLVHGLNRAIEAGSGEYVVLLNDDTEVDPGWLGELIGAAERHPDAGSIASKLLLMSDRGRFHSAGDGYAFNAMPLNRGVWLEDLGQYETEEEIFGACAGAALYRRRALENVRLPSGDFFDRRLYMYCEDVDLNWRLQRKNYSCYYAPQAIVYHQLSATGGGTLASYYVARNFWLVYARSVPKELFARHGARMAAYHLGRFLRALTKCNEPAARASIRGTLAGIVSLALNRTEVPRLDSANETRIRKLLYHPVDHAL